MVDLVKPEKPEAFVPVCAYCVFFVKSKLSMGQGDCQIGRASCRERV